MLKLLERLKPKSPVDRLRDHTLALDSFASSAEALRLDYFSKNAFAIHQAMHDLSGMGQDRKFKDVQSAIAILNQGNQFTHHGVKIYEVEDGAWKVERPELAKEFLNEYDWMLKKAFLYVVTAQGLTSALRVTYPKDFYMDEITQEMKSLLNEEKPIEFFEALRQLVGGDNDIDIKNIFSMDNAGLIKHGLDMLYSKHPEIFLFGNGDSTTPLDYMDTILASDYLLGCAGKMSEAVTRISPDTIKSSHISSFKMMIDKYGRKHFHGEVSADLRHVHADLLKSWIRRNFDEVTLTPLTIQGRQILSTLTQLSDSDIEDAPTLVATWSVVTGHNYGRSLSDLAPESLGFMLMRDPDNTGDGNKLAEIWAVEHNGSIVGVSRAPQEMEAFLSVYQANGFQRLGAAHSFAEFQARHVK